MAGMQKIKILSYDPKQKAGTKPMSKEEILAVVSHLQPIIDFLIATGNEPLFGPDSHQYTRSFDYTGNGWVEEGTMARDSIFAFRKPFSASEIHEHFELPESIVIIEEGSRTFIVDRSIHAKIYN